MSVGTAGTEMEGALTGRETLGTETLGTETLGMEIGREVGSVGIDVGIICGTGLAAARVKSAKMTASSEIMAMQVEVAGDTGSSRIGVAELE